MPQIALVASMKEEFLDIAPYDDSEFRHHMARLVDEPGFENAIKYIVPDADYTALVDMLKHISTKEEFQVKVMLHILEMLERKTTSGVTESGFETIKKDSGVLFISNHRDIVLDASFLGLVMIRHGRQAMEVALGDNLLIYPWIESLVRLNKGIIVKRNLRLTKALEAARQLSAYIRYAIGEKHESVWLAQREGRAKDSNDVTQESVIKMLALSGDKDEPIASKLMPLNITPVSISYEYDPNDYLKAREFLARKRDPEFKKSQRDDLFSMETGILQFKGKVNFAFGQCINNRLKALVDITDKAEVIREVCAAIDNEIHSHYRIYPINYIAYDCVEGSKRFAECYTNAEAEAFSAYVDGQLDKVDLPDITAEERAFMRGAILKMYANPLRNKLAATISQPSAECPI